MGDVATAWADDADGAGSGVVAERAGEGAGEQSARGLRAHWWRYAENRSRGRRSAALRPKAKSRVAAGREGVSRDARTLRLLQAPGACGCVADDAGASRLSVSLLRRARETGLGAR